MTELHARNLAHIWHPCSQMKDYETMPPIAIQRGQGVWLEDVAGNRYLDAISSWWVNLFGHRHPDINAAITEQLNAFSQIIFGGFTHTPAIELAEKLTRLAPTGLTRCAFASDGASSVEIALKMSYHYWLNHGRPEKSSFIHLTNSYHGETLGALAVTDVPLFKKTYQPLLMPALAAPSPDCYHREPGESYEAYSTRMFAPMAQLLAENSQRVAAVIIEPLVQGAAGMRMYHPCYLRLLREACDRHQVLLIADEIAVGFGRTGTMFACEQAGITPDIMCLSKGITGGYLPLSVALATDNIYQAFYDDYVNLTGFLHSHSYSGNALACSAAVATLNLFEKNNTLVANQSLARCLSESLQRFHDHPHIADVRQIGMIAAVEMVQNKTTRTPFPWQERRGMRVYQYALSKGVILRPIGNVIYFMPPYVITPQEIDLMVNVAWDGINQAVL